MVKKYLIFLLTTALLTVLTACEQGTGASKKQNNAEFKEEDSVVIYLPAESIVSTERKYERKVYERDQYGNIIRGTTQDANSDEVLTTFFTAEPHDDGIYYRINTLYDEYYDLTFNESGELISAQAPFWTLTYSDQEGSAYKEISYDKDYKHTYIRYYDEGYRLTDSYGSDFGSDEVNYEHHYTYNEQGQLIEERQIHHKNHYDFTSNYTIFCEMNRPLEFYYVAFKNSAHQLIRSPWTCECTYDEAGQVLTEKHTTTEGKVVESFEYAYDDDGNIIQMVDKYLGDAYYHDEVYHYDADGNLVGNIGNSLGHSQLIFRPYRVANDPLLLAFLNLREEGLYAGKIGTHSIPSPKNTKIVNSNPNNENGVRIQEAVNSNVNGQMANHFTKNVIASGQSSTLALKQDGTVYGQGFGPSTPYKVDDWSDIVSLYAGGYLTVGVKSDGTLIMTGKNDSGQKEIDGWKNLVELDMGNDHTVGLLENGTVVATGDNKFGQCNVSDWTDIVSISCGGTYTAGLKSNGTVVTTGVIEGSIASVDTSAWTDIIAIDAGNRQIIGLKSDGTAIVSADLSGNHDVSGWTDLVAVSSGYSHVVGLRSDGTVVASSINSDDKEAIDVSSWNNVVCIDAGNTKTVAVTSDGNLLVACVSPTLYSDWSGIMLPSTQSEIPRPLTSEKEKNEKNFKNDEKTTETNQEMPSIKPAILYENKEENSSNTVINNSNSSQKNSISQESLKKSNTSSEQIEPSVKDPWAGKYKTNYVMKIRSEPNYEGERLGRKEEGATFEVIKSVEASNNSVWGQLPEGGWICLKDADLVYTTKIE